MNITDFVAACDAFCARHNVTRVWLSKRLLADTYKLDNLAKGSVDIGVKRLEQAFADLAGLEKERAEQASQGQAA
jgi:hypothetical protein